MIMRLLDTEKAYREYQKAELGTENKDMFQTDMASFKSLSTILHSPSV